MEQRLGSLFQGGVGNNVGILARAAVGVCFFNLERDFKRKVFRDVFKNRISH